MNLTPTTAPEFLIQAPDGLKFRLRSQALAETFYEDGDQLQPFQYRNGLLAQATVTLAADATLSDIPTSTDLVLIKEESSLQRFLNHRKSCGVKTMPQLFLFV